MRVLTNREMHGYVFVYLFGVASMTENTIKYSVLGLSDIMITH